VIGLVAIVVVLVLRAPAAAHDFTAAFAKLRPIRLPWLAAAVGAELVSFVFYAHIQATLLDAGGRRMNLLILLRLSVASSGLRALLPAGVVPSSGWLYEQYRKADVEGPLSAFVVLASGFFSTVTLLAILLVAAAIAGVGSPALLAASGAVLVLGSAGFVALAHRIGAFERLVAGHTGRVADGVRRVIRFADGVAICHVGRRRSVIVFAEAAGNWLSDLVCLIGAFSLLNLAIPWRGLLFAYAAAQLAGSIVPLPGGLGAVEGGLVGALDLTGVPAGSALAAAIVYRVITYWGVGIVGVFELATLSRHATWADQQRYRSSPTPELPARPAERPERPVDSTRRTSREPNGPNGG